MKEYIERAKPIFSVGEYWDSCNYSGYFYLDYNQGIMSLMLFYTVDSGSIIQKIAVTNNREALRTVFTIFHMQIVIGRRLSIGLMERGRFQLHLTLQLREFFRYSPRHCNICRKNCTKMEVLF